MSFWKRIKARTIGERIEVQLHRLQYGGNSSDTILNSWEPIVVHGWWNAYLQAHQLREDNRWASQHDGPMVTVTGEDGVRRGDWIMSPHYRGSDSIYESHVLRDGRIK